MDLFQEGTRDLSYFSFEFCEFHCYTVSPFNYVPFLEALFSSLIAFAVSFFLVYVPMATIIGWLDYKRFAVPVDLTVMARANPWVQDLTRALMLMCDEKYDDAKKILQKWIEK